MSTDWAHATRRYIFTEEDPSFAKLPALTRGLARQLSTVCDRAGVIPVGAEDATAVLLRRLGAHVGERRMIRQMVPALIAARYLVAEPGALVVRNFLVAHYGRDEARYAEMARLRDRTLAELAAEHAAGPPVRRPHRKVTAKPTARVQHERAEESAVPGRTAAVVNVETSPAERPECAPRAPALRPLDTSVDSTRQEHASQSGKPGTLVSDVCQIVTPRDRERVEMAGPEAPHVRPACAPRAPPVRPLCTNSDSSARNQGIQSGFPFLTLPNGEEINPKPPAAALSSAPTTLVARAREPDETGRQAGRPADPVAASCPTVERPGAINGMDALAELRAASDGKLQVSGTAPLAVAFGEALASLQAQHRRTDLVALLGAFAKAGGFAWMTRRQVTLPWLLDADGAQLVDAIEDAVAWDRAGRGPILTRAAARRVEPRDVRRGWVPAAPHSAFDSKRRDLFEEPGDEDGWDPTGVGGYHDRPLARGSRGGA